jgi:[ribosomal protein S18]-alanine N-acetyltransferase
MAPGFALRRLTDADPDLDARIAEASRIDSERYGSAAMADFLDRQARTESGRLLAATDATGRAVGFLLVQVAADEASIIDIAVLTESRRRGIGQTLLAEGLRRLRREDRVHVVTLEVRPSNAPALGLYRKFGFAERGRRPNYYQNNGEDALLMRLEL